MIRLVSTVGVSHARRRFGLGRGRDLETQNRRSAGWLPAVVSCAPVGIRTPNLLIRSQMLYPLSYRRPSTHLRERLDENSRPRRSCRNQDHPRPPAGPRPGATVIGPE